jgi:DNA-directed RNA polymerase subunit omega
MIEELKNTDIVNKVGGRFKLSALIQKRMLELMEGGRPLIEDTEGMTQMEIVVQEIKQDKICLDATGDEKKKPAIDVL